MPSRRARSAALSVAAFVVSFLVVFLAVFFSQSANSLPAGEVFAVDEMEIVLGPPPNSTDIPLDTTITVDAVASTALDDLRLTPDTPISRVYSEATSALTYLNIFYPAHLLKPNTLYTVSVTIFSKPISWSFTITDEPFKPGIGFYLATNNMWISLSAAVASTVIAALTERNKSENNRGVKST